MLMWGNKRSADTGNTSVDVQLIQAILVLMWGNKPSAARGNTGVDMG